MRTVSQMADTSPDNPISRELRAWRVAPRRNPTFRSETWARIEAHRADLAVGWGHYLRRHGVAWVAVFVLTAIGAGWSGHAVGRQRNERDRDAILASYVAAIDVRAALETRP